MNFCMPHWQELKAEVTRLGLDQYIAKDGATLVKDLVETTEHEIVTLETFDPLMAAAVLMFTFAMEKAGLALLAPDPVTGKPPCPLCMVAGPHATNWIKGSVGNCHDLIERLKVAPDHSIDLREAREKDA